MTWFLPFSNIPVTRIINIDFYLRCNSLKCRCQLKEQAVVNDLHIFCSSCASALGLSSATAGGRHCPACQIILVNPDDAIITALKPTEDYKTSVLSGLDPNTIMECAGRALLFWTYQTTQEMREFLAKTLTDKYTGLNTQMDKATHEQLQKKNQELVDLYREKRKKLTQITNLYNQLKSRAMRSHLQTAPSDSVSQALNSLRPPRNEPSITSTSKRPSSLPGPLQTPSLQGVEQLYRYQRSGTGSSKGARKRTDATVMSPPSLPGNARNLILERCL
ncbi:uncharacterized protein BDW43DRAFT_297037 [Aspergillus alliaceus]|uniref:uncharacterized protein n=1 Tax=Petromyces alliaceus TaxID=209559 RepID=UPI0012A711B1|nr:uncharacterized protein BDW43DRAFT_297037 [Aspergillus alliaceus]KAB8238093.1 hypothetical protein BDW43DRAFT_297037 [Aspergillus alliaceus]